MYTLKVSLIHSHALGTINYQTIHHCLGHPSKDVAKQTKQHTSGLLDFTIPNDVSIVCPGCAKPQCSFSPTSVCTKYTFELIHMDIKSFPTELYHKYKYLIIFLDDFNSMAWTILLHMKSAAFNGHLCHIHARSSDPVRICSRPNPNSYQISPLDFALDLYHSPYWTSVLTPPFLSYALSPFS